MWGEEREGEAEEAARMVLAPSVSLICKGGMGVGGCRGLGGAGR